jgi:hypothetical protein
MNCARFLLMVFVPVCGFCAEISTGQLTIPYGEFRSLLEKSNLPPRPKPPVPAVILATKFRVDLRDPVASGQLTFEVRSFGSDAQLIRLIGEAVTIRSIKPESLTVIRKDGFYQLLAEAAEVRTVQLEVGWNGREEERERVFQCAVSPSAIFQVELVGLSEGHNASVAGAYRDPRSGIFHLGAAETLKISVSQADREEGPTVTMPPVIANAENKMRIVRDGTYLNATTWTIRHTKPFVWRVNPGADTQLVSALVDGRPVAPVQSGDGALEFRLSEKSGESRVALTYTGKSSPFELVRGDLAISLPATDLLVECQDWALLLPAGYAPVAVEGNFEFLPGESVNELRLRRELNRGEVPRVRVFYQKPETNKKP